MDLPMMPLTVYVVLDPDCGIPHVFAEQGHAEQYAARASGELPVFAADVVDHEAAAALITDHYNEDNEA